MTATLQDYREIVGPEVIEELHALAGRLRSRSCQHLNSTPVGGEVAELLTRLVPLMREAGIDTKWDVIKGDEQFSVVTRTLSQALGGKPEVISDAMVDTYRATMEMNLQELQFTGDVIFVHDPQPSGLVARKAEIGRRWIWRSHMDLSAPDAPAWAFLRPVVEKYDAAIFSMPDFAQPLPIPQYVIPPSIDPLSDRNRELGPDFVREVLQKYGVDPDRPLISQVSRFERGKDPLGVVEAYRLVRRRNDCQLILAGDQQIDDPESLNILSELQEQAEGDRDIHILLLPPFSDLEINAIVRGSTVVMQKSLREGFGLAVSEAMWKRKPVVGGAAGGIKRQIVNGFTGFLVYSPEGAAHRVTQLLADPDMCRRMGDNGQIYVRQNFLLTRQLKDYLLVMLALDYPDQDVVFLA